MFIKKCSTKLMESTKTITPKLKSQSTNVGSNNNHNNRKKNNNKILDQKIKEQFRTNDDHVNDEHAQIINHNASLEESPSGTTEGVADHTRIRRRLRSSREPEDHVNGGLSEQRA